MFLVGSFFLFAAFLITTCIFVIFSKNPVNSVLFLVLAFLNSTFLFILIGAEFVGIILAIVYIGAVAILCLLYTSPSPRDSMTSRMPSSA